MEKISLLSSIFLFAINSIAAPKFSELFYSGKINELKHNINIKLVDNTDAKDDDNNLKQGKLTPGKNIKIIKFKELHKIKFNYIIILAWNFAKPIIKKLKNNFKSKKFKIIVPFPDIKII